MNSRHTKIFGIIAGIMIMISGIQFVQWVVPFDIIESKAQALHVFNHIKEGIIYTILMNGSYLLFLPIALLLTIKLYCRKPILSLLCISLFLFGMIADFIGSVPYLTQAAYILPECKKNNIDAINLFSSFYLPMRLFAMVGTGLSFLSFLLWGINLIFSNKITGIFLILTFLSMVLAGIFTPFSSELALFAVGSSFFLFGISQICVSFIVPSLNVQIKK